MLNTQSLSPVKLCHHPGTILPILHPCWALGSHVCTLSANGKYPALRNKLCRGAQSLNFSRRHPQLREKRGPLTWQAPQLGLWTCNVWEAKGFAEPSVPITHETKMPFSFQRRTWKRWPHLTPHQNPTKKILREKTKDFFMAATEVVSAEEFPRGSQTEGRDLVLSWLGGDVLQRSHVRRRSLKISGWRFNATLSLTTPRQRCLSQGTKLFL